MDSNTHTEPLNGLFPKEILLRIFFFLSKYNDQKQCSLVCRTWNEAIRESAGQGWVWLHSKPIDIEHDRVESYIPPYGSDDWNILMQSMKTWSRATRKLGVELYSKRYNNDNTKALEEILCNAKRLEALHVVGREPELVQVLSWNGKRLPPHVKISGFTHVGVLAPCTQIKHLSILNSPGLSTLSSVSFILNLTSLSLVGCQGLSSIDSLCESTHGNRLAEQLTSIEIVHCNDIHSIEVFRRLQNLQKICLGNLSLIPSLSPLELCIQLKSLSLRCMGERKLSIPSTLSNIVTLVLEHVNLLDYEVLTSSRNTLESIEVQSTHGPNFYPLPLLPCLKRFVTNIPLGELDFPRDSLQLKHIEITLKDRETSLQYLSALTNLTHVHINECPYIESISFISELAFSLRYLTLTRLLLTDISVISQCSHLTYLDLSGGKGIFSIEPVMFLRFLRELYLDDCVGLSNVSALTIVPTLTHLSLSKCHSLTNVAQVSVLPSLKYLNVSNSEGLSLAEPFMACEWQGILNTSNCNFLDYPVCAGIFTGEEWKNLVENIVRYRSWIE